MPRKPVKVPTVGEPLGDSSRQAKVTDEHREEAQKLKELFEGYVQKQAQKGVKVTQAGFAAAAGLGSQGLLWQYLNARIPLNLRAGLQFVKGIGCRLEEFSPRLATEQATLSHGAPAGPKTALQTVLELNPMEQQLLGLYRELTPDQQHDLLVRANELHAKTHLQSSEANPFGGRKVAANAER